MLFLDEDRKKVEGERRKRTLIAWSDNIIIFDFLRKKTEDEITALEKNLFTAIRNHV